MATIIESLRAYLDGLVDVDVVVSVPPERPDELVLVTPVTGSSEDDFNRPTYLVQAWAASSARAEELMDEVDAALAQPDPELGFDVVEARDVKVPFDGYDGRHFRWQKTYRALAIGLT